MIQEKERFQGDSKLARAGKVYRAIWASARQARMPPAEIFQVLASAVAALSSIQAADPEDREKRLLAFKTMVDTFARSIPIDEAKRRAMELLEGFR